jgi:putative FmdB family regulatory protein
MPIYEYKCRECGTCFEVIRSMNNADEAIECEDCASLNTSRQISNFYAQSGGRIIAGNNNAGCAGCSANSCSTCGT